MEFNELQHAGTKGMKWGHRRYQNKDGSLTPAGRARYLNKAREYERKANTSVADNYFAKSRRARLTEKAKEARREVRRSDLAKARAKNQETSSGKRSVKDMSTEELRKYVTEREDRINLEQRYAKLNPEKVSRGKKFAKYTLDKVVVPALTEGSKQYMTELTKTGLKSAQKKLSKN